ncbi:hypothetical protein IWGMT90018_40730 [Mycobacterium kiyosense]|nr:hypothetical protein IWGMT90018_40730 [Mycobacterium kiyosense]
MSNTPNNKPHNNNPSPDDDWIGELIVAAVKAAGQLLWWAILFPVLSVPVIVALWVTVSHGARAGVLTAIAEIAAYVGWSVCEPSSFSRWVTNPLRQRFWAWWRYHRNWASVCALHGLTAKLGERTLVPAVESVRIGRHADVLCLRVVTGQSIADWQKRAPALAATWGAQRLTIRATAPGQLRIIIGRGDVLGQPIAVPMPTPATEVDLGAVRVGHRITALVDVAGARAAPAGCRCHRSGQGFGAVVADRRAGTPSENRAGAAGVKGGMELGAGAPLFTRFCYHTGQPTVELLQRLVELMHARATPGCAGTPDCTTPLSASRC